MSASPTSSARAATLLDADPASVARSARATPRAIGARPLLPVLSVEPGPWEPPAPRRLGPGTIALAVLDGLLLGADGGGAVGPGDGSRPGRRRRWTACTPRAAGRDRRAFTEALRAVAGASAARRSRRRTPAAITLAGRGRSRSALLELLWRVALRWGTSRGRRRRAAAERSTRRALSLLLGAPSRRRRRRRAACASDGVGATRDGATGSRPARPRARAAAPRRAAGAGRRAVRARAAGVRPTASRSFDLDSSSGAGATRARGGSVRLGVSGRRGSARRARTPRAPAVPGPSGQITTSRPSSARCPLTSALSPVESMKPTSVRSTQTSAAPEPGVEASLSPSAVARSISPLDGDHRPTAVDRRLDLEAPSHIAAVRPVRHARRRAHGQSSDGRPADPVQCAPRRLALPLRGAAGRRNLRRTVGGSRAGSASGLRRSSHRRGSACPTNSFPSPSVATSQHATAPPACAPRRARHEHRAGARAALSERTPRRRAPARGRPARARVHGLDRADAACALVARRRA